MKPDFNPRVFTTLAILIIIFAFASSTYAQTGNYHNGGYRIISNKGSSATIETQNPYVPSNLNVSCAWVMTCQDSSYWAQVGWIKYNGWSGPKYYYEYNGTSGWNQVTLGNATSGSHNDYMVGSDSTYMYFKINSSEVGKIALSSLGFTPNQVQLYSETTESTVQSPGSVSNPVTMGTFKYKSTSDVWTSTNAYNGSSLGYGELTTQKNNISSSGNSSFEVWDSRY